MNLIVLGASSIIGSEIAAQFAPGNNLLLVGRNGLKLLAAAELCRENGGVKVETLVADLHTSPSEIERAANHWNVETIINAACSTSRLRDDDINPDDLQSYLAVDLLGPLELIQSIRRNSGHKNIRVIFVSSLLAVVRSPHRLVYSSFKSMHELLLAKLLKAHPSIQGLIVRVAISVPPDERTARTVELARAVRKAFDEGKTELFFGTTGRILSWLYYAQPMVFNMVVEMSRRFRPALPRTEEIRPEVSRSA